MRLEAYRYAHRPTVYSLRHLRRVVAGWPETETKHMILQKAKTAELSLLTSK
jgi:hypothetical protein